MASTSAADRMTEELARFEVALRDTALAIVREVIARELARRDDDDDEAEDEDDEEAEDDAAPVDEPVAVAPARAAVAAPPKRPGWTRETVIAELATWLLSGTTVEASFVKRYGQPGLAAAAKRIFGRFDAALNAANLNLAQRFPDGPPKKKAMS